jgi:hypothetical protein
VVFAVMFVAPDDWEVYASITMVYPKYKFRRIAPGKLAEARFLS